MASAGTAPSEVPSEDREFIEQLAKLQNMHNQIHDLRGLLPERLLKPTKAALENPSRSSPAKLAADLRETAMQGSKDIRRFATDFRSEPMQQLLQKSGTGEFPQGRDAWTINYNALLKSTLQSNNVPPTSNANGVAIKPESENVEDVVKTFQEANPSVKLDRVNSPSMLPLDVNINGLKLRITQKESDGKTSYHVATIAGGTSDLSADVVSAIEHGGYHQNLGLFLSMLASYRDLKFRPCDNCKAIFDKNVTYPVVRRQKPVSGKDDPSVEWIALHQGCTS